MSQQNQQRANTQRELRKLETMGFSVHEAWMLTERHAPRDIEQLLSERTIPEIQRDFAHGHDAAIAPILFPY